MSYCVFDSDSMESTDLEVFYKGKKVINVERIITTSIDGFSLKTDNSFSWKKYLEDNYVNK